MELYDEELELLTADEADDGETETSEAPDAVAGTALAPVSGLYERRGRHGTPHSLAPAPLGIRPIRKEEIRLDVDGRYPQMTVSGTIRGFLVQRIHWIARLRKTGQNRWIGSIWYKDGAAASFPYTVVEVRASGGAFPSTRHVKIVFSGGGSPKRTVNYRYVSKYYRTVNIELDVQAGEVLDTAIDTCAHPIRPPSLPCENLTVQKVFQRAGFQVTTNAPSQIPAPPGSTWSDMEMHDAMQIHWTRFANKAQWAMWVFYASLAEAGTGLGGIMFDDIGPNHRQGTALFVDSFIADPHPNDPDSAAWVDRMRFWTAVHEMGHSFNLAHSWQKSLGVPWIPLANEPAALSFMNYPHNAVFGTPENFFSQFEFRFSDQELLFVRHAPERFVEMGNAAWFDHHGFEEAAVPEQPTLELELRVNRDQPRLEFLEPAWIEVKLTNIGTQPRLVASDVLDASSLTVILKKEGRDARQLVPFRQKCLQTETKTLMPDESIYGTVLASAGINGWDVAEPGTYTVQAAAHVGDEDVVSAPLTLRIAPPVSREEEYYAGDLFTQDAARVLVFGGSRFLEGANDVLREVIDRFPERRIALHAQVSLGNPLTIPYKLVLPTDEEEAIVELREPEPTEAASLLEPALVDKPDIAAQTFGHIRYLALAERAAIRLAEAGAETEATETIDAAIDTLDARIPDDRPVKADVMERLKEIRATVAAKPKTKSRARAKA